MRMRGLEPPRGSAAIWRLLSRGDGKWLRYWARGSPTGVEPHSSIADIPGVWALSGPFMSTLLTRRRLRSRRPALAWQAVTRRGCSAPQRPCRPQRSIRRWEPKLAVALQGAERPAAAHD